MRAFTAGRGFSGVCQLGVCQLVLGVDPGCVWLAPLEWGATEGVVVVERCVRGGLFVSSTAMIVRIVSLQSNTAAPGIVSPLVVFKYWLHFLPLPERNSSPYLDLV